MSERSWNPSGDRREAGRGRKAGAGTLAAVLLALHGCDPARQEAAVWPSVPVEIELRIAQVEPAASLLPVEVLGERETVHLHPQSFVTSLHVTAADAFEIPEGVILEVWFNEEGRERIAAATSAHLGQRIAVLIDSVAVSAPEIVGPLSPRLALQIPVRLPPLEAERLVAAVEASW